MQSTAAPVGPSAGAPTQLDEDLLLLAMQRTWTIAAMQGAFGIDRRRLLELARRTNGRDCTGLAIDALEAGGHLVALDRERVRAGRVFRRSDAVWLPQWLPRKRPRLL